MSNIPTELKYTTTHEWANRDGEDVCTIGITDHAQSLLGDVVYVDLPEVGSAVNAGKGFGVIESVKAASDLYSPFTGKVIAVNQELVNNPALANTDPYLKGWLIKVEPSDMSEYERLLDASQYAKNVDTNSDH